MVTKVNPVYDPTIARSFLGKTIASFTVGITPDVTGSTAPGEAIDAMIKALSLNATVVAISDIDAAGFDFWVEGDFPTDTYDGTASETFAAHMEDVLQALGTVDALDLSATTVTAGTVFQADQAN
jgi:hypothetical protein